MFSFCRAPTMFREVGHQSTPPCILMPIFADFADTLGDFWGAARKQATKLQNSNVLIVQCCNRKFTLYSCCRQTSKCFYSFKVFLFFQS